MIFLLKKKKTVLILIVYFTSDYLKRSFNHSLFSIYISMYRDFKKNSSSNPCVNIATFLFA